MRNIFVANNMYIARILIKNNQMSRDTLIFFGESNEKV